VELKRRYVYQEDYDMIMEWGYKNKIITPNRKANFAFWLQEFLKRLTMNRQEFENRNLRGVSRDTIKAAAKAGPLKLAMKIYNSVCPKCRMMLIKNPKEPTYCEFCKQKVEAMIDAYDD
jgi:hypothetical protein